MSTKAKSSPSKASPKKKAPAKSSGGVTKPKTKPDPERFKKTETKSNNVALRGEGNNTELADIQKTLQAAAKPSAKGGKKKRLSAMERTALEGSNFALKGQTRRVKK